jgi:hypothetical protein
MTIFDGFVMTLSVFCGNFIYEAIVDRNWSRAADRTFYQFGAILLCVYFY